MFFQYQSDSLILLSKSFSDHISDRKSEHPFQKTWVVVQNKEAQQWLTLQVASYSGIAANFEFILPSELIWKLYRNFFPDTPKVLPGDRIPLQWIIYDFLMDTDQKVFQKIKGFPEINDEVQAYRLSVQLADVFDLYQVYRPEMTEAWKKWVLSTKNPQEYWQLWVWREIQSRLTNQNQVSDRGFVFAHLLKQIKEGSFDGESLPSSIYCFGLSQFSQPFGELICELSRKIDLNYYSTKFDSDSEDLFSIGWKTLSEEWGKPKFNSEKLVPDFLKPDEIKVFEFDNGKSGSVYSKIQKIEESDSLIGIHSCHSPRREVEILKDRLLKRLDSDSTLKPQDILIMVPDMKEYASLIQSEFTSGAGEPEIPVYVPGTYSKPDLIAFSKLLDLISSSYKVNDFVDFIELEAIRDRFNLSEDELVIIRGWIHGNNIFWGLDEDDSSFSLKKLSKALIGGYVTETEAYTSFEDFIPFELISTTDQFALSAKLASLINQLINLKEELNTPKTPVSWIDCFVEATANLINQDASTLHSSLVKLREACTISGISNPVTFSIISQWIKSQLGDLQATSSGFGHGVVVSSYIPYRGIPFKEIAILGMNESVFPRNPDRPSFDLINIDPKPGDRITKEDDALLFLEVLNSASNYLYISFIGQDLYSENEKLPSILLQKLMDVASESGYEIAVEKEQLHGFNSKYFDQGESYSTHRKKLAQLINSHTKSVSTFFNLSEFGRKETPSKIHKSELINFCTHPNKFVIQQILLVSEGYGENELSDRELFSLNGLSTWLLNNQLLDAYKYELSETEAFDFMGKAGLIPEGIPGEKVFFSQSMEVKHFLSLLDKYRNSGPKMVQCIFQTDEVELFGNIGDLVDGRRVVWRMGRSRPKDLVGLWIEHLILASQSIDYTETLFITNEKGNVQTIQFGCPENTDQILSELLDWFLNFGSGKDSLAFFANSSFAYAQKLFQGKDEEEALKSAQSEWTSTERSSGDDNDFYINLVWKGEDPIQSEAFKKQALMFWEPVLKHLRVDK